MRASMAAPSCAHMLDVTAVPTSAFDCRGCFYQEMISEAYSVPAENA